MTVEIRERYGRTFMSLCWREKLLGFLRFDVGRFTRN